jgi:hypothetical protein
MRARTIALTLALALILTVSSGCGYKSYNERGMWQEFPGIFTAVEPADLDLYRKLLPENLDMPERPVVALFVVDYVIVVPYPMGPYLEGAVALSCKYKGEDGWHVLTMPVTTKVACEGGRAIGFPKYVADSITLGKAGNGMKGEVRHQGVVRLSLEYTPGLTRKLEPYEEEFMGGGVSRLEEPVFQLAPPDKGPTLNRITLVPVVPANWESEQGMVKIHISPNDPWAGLIPDNAVSPGLFQTFTGGNNMKSEKVN